jgi:hypothetical protein
MSELKKKNYFLIDKEWRSTNLLIIVPTFEIKII